MGLVSKNELCSDEEALRLLESRSVLSFQALNEMAIEYISG